MTKVELVKAKAFEIDPTKKYLIILPAEEFSEEDAFYISKEMKDWFVKATVLLTTDPEVIKIMETK